MKNINICVITYQYLDKSKFGIVGVYGIKSQASEIMGILEEHGDNTKKFEMREIPCEIQQDNAKAALDEYRAITQQQDKLPIPKLA